MWFRTQKKGAILRPAMVLLSVATIAFPPNVFADAVTFQWNGSQDSHFSNASDWTCDPTCSSSPDNTAAGAAVDAIINSGQPDNVLLDTPSIITSLSLGGISPTSTLTTNGPALTLGTPTDYRQNVLAINNGGTLNINSATVTLDLSGRDGYGDASGALVGYGGVVTATNGTLLLQNSGTDGIGAVVTNDGSISLDATSSLTLSGAGNFALNSNSFGSLSLSGATIAGSESTSLTNIGEHLISGNGEIDPHFSNSAYVEASGGTLSILHLDDLNHHGVLTQGVYTVDDGATLTYSSSKTVHQQEVANDITSIGANAELDLNGSGQVLNTYGGSHDAVSGSLKSVDGTLTLNNYFDSSQAATLTLTNQLTNRADVDVYAGSTLTTQGFRNYANQFTSSCGCGASFELVGGNAQINGDLSNHADIVGSHGYGEPSVEIGMDQGSTMHVTGNVWNSATTANSQTTGSSAYMWLDGQSSLTVDGNLTNDSHGMGGFGYSPAELDLDSSTATVTGKVSNLGGSALMLDYNDGAGSTLNATGGLVNSNSFVFLTNGSTLNVGQTSPAAAQSDQPTWAAQNLAGDTPGASLYGPPSISLLQVGYTQGLFGPPDSNEEFTPAASVMNVTGGLLNQATSSNGGAAVSVVDVDSGSTLNADRVLNAATVTAGTGQAEAGIDIINGSTLNLATSDHTGVLTNSANPGTGFALADVNVSGGSALIADSVVNQFTSSPDGLSAAAISIDASTMTVNKTFDNLGGVLNLTSGATVNVGGQFTNDAHGVVSLDAPSPSAADGLTGSVLNTHGFSNSGLVALSQESTINNTGDFQNSGTVTIDNHSALNIVAQQADGSANTLLSSFEPTLTNTGTIATGTGGEGGNQILVQGEAFNTAPGVINIQGEGDNMTVTGQFSNSGSVAIGSGATVQAASYTQTDGRTDIGQGGTLEATVNVTGGTVSGGGTIIGDVTIDGGTLAPGDPQSIDIIGDYHQTLLGILDVDLAGLGDGEYDEVHVQSDDDHPGAGNVWLGGTLEITLEDGFGAGINIGDVFHILTWTGQESGDFDAFINRSFWNGAQNLWFQEVLVAGGVDLDVVATPEPTTLAMLFGAMLLAGGAVWTRRRRGIRQID